MLDKINFKALPLYKNVKIKKYNETKKVFERCNACFIKLDPHNPNDTEAINLVAQNWDKNLYIKKIATAAHWMDYLPIDIYALTLQTNNLDKLEYSKILGFAEIRNDTISRKYKLLYHLQVKPEAINVEQSKEIKYKNVGRSIINSLKKVYSNISLFSIKDPKIEEFHKNNGFIRDLRNDGRFLWSSNVIEVLKNYISNFFYPF